MESFVIICPKCGQYNPEEENSVICKKCAQFLGMEQPQPRPKATEPPSSDAESKTPQSGDGSSNHLANNPQMRGAVTQVCVQKVLYLKHRDLPNPIEVQSGCVVGQKDPSSRADVQIDGIENVNYISREHCRFNCDDGVWSVLVLPETTNPTTLNQRRISRGQEVAISNGDQLIMANVGFQIKIIQA